MHLHDPVLDPPLDFPGRQTLIDAIDAAVALSDDAATVQALRGALCRMMREQSVRLPDCVLQTVEGHYARRELYVSPEHGYGVIAMTWGPNQGTPIHDHSGLWCVEGVWHGQLEITQYDLGQRDGDRYRFVEWRDRKSGQPLTHELYDHQSDPAENQNIAGRPENKDLVTKLAAQLKDGWKGAKPK